MRRARRVARRAAGLAWIEALEHRQLLAAPEIAPITAVSVPAGKTLFVPVQGSDADGDPLTYTVTSSNGAVTAQVRSGHPFLKMSVAGYGDMVFQLFDDLAPQTVQTMTTRLSGLSGQEFYRVIKGFMNQGGNPSDTSAEFNDEFNPNAIFSGTGQLAMANRGKDTNTSQYFVTVGPQRFLDFNHAIWGQLVRGQDVLAAINNAATNASDKPLTPITVSSVSLVPDTTDTVLMLKAPAGAGASTITVTASDGQGNTTSTSFEATYQADTTNDPPILGPVSDQTTAVGVPSVFSLTATDLENDPVEYKATVLSGLATATVSGSTVTVTPTGPAGTPIRVQVGVKQVGATSRGSTADPYDYQTINVNVVNPTITATGANVSGTAGTALSGTVAQFTANPASPASAYSATINYGDGTTAPGSIVATTTGFGVVASHTYARAGSYPISVAIKGPGTSTASATATATVAAAAAGTLTLAVTDSPDPVTAGQPLTYSITVTNPGSAAITGATLTQTLPAGTTFVSSTITPSSSTSTELRFPLGDLASGASRTFQVVVTPANAGTLSTVFSSTGTGVTTPVTTTAVTTVNAAATNPTTGPQIVDLSRQGIHTDPTRITLKFNADLDPTRAQNPANYRLIAPGHDTGLGTRDDVVVPITSATYDAATRTVTLVPKYRLNWHWFAQLSVVSGGATGLTDTDGRALDGDRNGRPGGTFVARFARGVYFDAADRLARLSAYYNGQQVPRGPLARSMDTGELYTGPIQALLSKPDSAAFRAAVATLPASAFERVDATASTAAFASATALVRPTAFSTLVQARKARLGVS